MQGAGTALGPRFLGTFDVFKRASMNPGTAPLPNPLPARSSRGEGGRSWRSDGLRPFSLSSPGGEGWGEEALFAVWFI
jgi:hypothetical protein